MRRTTSPLRRRSSRQDSKTFADPHEPLLGSWLIRLALCFGWYRKPMAQALPSILENDMFSKLTGFIPPTKVDEDGDLCPDRKAIGRLTDEKLAIKLESLCLDLDALVTTETLPLTRNVSLLGKLLGLTEVDQAVLQFAVMLSAFSPVTRIVREQSECVSQQQLARAIAATSGQSLQDIVRSLKADSVMQHTGMIRIHPANMELEHKIEPMDRLAGILLCPEMNEQTLINDFIGPTSPGTLSLDAFPHLKPDLEAVLPYLRNVLAQRESGANVLFYGAPGTGKTELAKAIAKELEVTLYEVAYADQEGNPEAGRSGRLGAYNVCQRFMSNMPRALLMFDEIEDVFPSEDMSFLQGLLGGTSGSHSSGVKAWVNRTLERNPMPAIWVTNSVNIDPAYLRRFDYSIRFPIPPHSVRVSIAKHHFGEFSPTENWLQAIAANEQASPAQLERAARVGRIVAEGNNSRAVAIAEQVLDRSSSLLGQKRLPVRNKTYTGYDLSFVNADVDLPRVLAGLKQRPRGSFCFYGPAGTGKSELGRHIADTLDMPVLLHRASDLLSMWVGGSEKNIAAMFNEARQQEGVLILDEADSFLGDRRDARASWELTQVNELLTQMEAFEGIFICTTNLMQKLDQASLRRFAFKVKFDYLSPTQRWQMFVREFERLGGAVEGAASLEASVRSLEQLTPGDFAVAARQYALWGNVPPAAEFYEQLRKECIAKGAPMRHIGFAA